MSDVIHDNPHVKLEQLINFDYMSLYPFSLKMPFDIIVEEDENL